MLYLCLDRHTFHKAPPAETRYEDRYAALAACEAYGEVFEPYEVCGHWVMASDHVNGFAVLQADTPEELWKVSYNYPGTTVEWGNEYDILPLIDNDFYWETLIQQERDALAARGEAKS